MSAAEVRVQSESKPADDDVFADVIDTNVRTSIATLFERLKNIFFSS